MPPDSELEKRLEAVLEAIYLLFNEGYSASVGEEVIRKDLCFESIRLAEMIAKHNFIKDKSSVYALIALMQLNACRFEARQDNHGNVLTLKEQNRALWDFELMEKGFSNLRMASQNEEISKYHILASISAYHCSAKDFNSTDWESILWLYDKLSSVDRSPILVLNKSIVMAQLGKTSEALEEMTAIEQEKIMKSNHFFYATKAELLFQIQEIALAREAMKKAIKLAPLSSEKNTLKLRYDKYFNNNFSSDVPIT